MKFLIGTTSNIKLEAIEGVLNTYKNVHNQTFEIISQDIASEVPDTPYDDQTQQGAYNRARALYQLKADTADFFVGLESGLIERSGMVFEECWCVILDKQGKKIYGYSSGFMLPNQVTDDMKKGRSHIEILNELADKLNLNSKDTWSIYSKGLLSRSESIREAFRNAFLSLEYTI